MRSTFQRYSPQHGLVRRRKKLADFLINHVLHGENVSLEIQGVEGLASFDSMVESVKQYLVLTLGYSFIDHLLKVVVQYDEATSTTKILGFFLRGPPSSGKSQALKIIFHIYDSRYILNQQRVSEQPTDVTQDGNSNQILSYS